MKYTDPSGHMIVGDEKTYYDNTCTDPFYCANGRSYIRTSTPHTISHNTNTPSASPNFPSLPPINLTLKAPEISSNPVLYYITLLSMRVKFQPSLTISPGSPVTLTSDRQTILSGTVGGMSTRVSFDGSENITGFGNTSADQLNNQITRVTGNMINLAPNELNVTILSSTVVNIPNTGISIGVNTPITVGIRYNPLTLAAAPVEVGAALFGPLLTASSASIGGLILQQAP